MFNAIFGQATGTVLGQIDAHKNRERIRRSKKIRITGANTAQPGIASGAGAVTYHSLPYEQRMKVNDYLDELRQQAKWDAEKCANQQSKNI